MVKYGVRFPNGTGIIYFTKKDLHYIYFYKYGVLIYGDTTKEAYDNFTSVVKDLEEMERDTGIKMWVKRKESLKNTISLFFGRLIGWVFNYKPFEILIAGEDGENHYFEDPWKSKKHKLYIG